MLINRAKRIIAGMLAVLLMVSGGMLVAPPDSRAYAAENDRIAESYEEQRQKAKAPQLRNVMYYGDWSIWGGQGNFYPKGIAGDQLTHLNYAFIDMDANGNLVYTDPDAAVAADNGYGAGWSQINSGLIMAFQQLRAENPNLKIGASFGGWSKSADFSRVAADPAKRAHFVSQMTKFAKYAGLDFIDIDWEYPNFVRQPDKCDNKNDEGTPYSTPADKENFVTLLRETRAALDTLGKEVGKYYELSVALPANKKKVDAGLDVAGIFSVVDFANIMTYDLRGAWDDTSGHHTGLYPNSHETMKGDNLSVSESVDYFLQQGGIPNKIVVGVAFYSRGWEKVVGGTDPNNPGLFGQAQKISKDADQTPSYGARNEIPLTHGDQGRSSGLWSQRNMSKLTQTYPGLKEYWDDEAQAPYMYDSNSGAFFTYDNARSIQAKADYVKSKGLGGLITWMASMDAPSGSGKRDTMTKVMKEALFGSAPLTQRTIKYADINVSVKIENTYTNTSWIPEKDRHGYKIVVSNNEVRNESGVVGSVQAQHVTGKLPKFYIKGSFGKGNGDYGPYTVSQSNGYTVVDFSNAYQGANMLKPGGSLSFSLKGQAPIEDMYMTQKLMKAGPEVAKQQLIGGSVTPPAPEPKPDPKPDVPVAKTVFSGIGDMTINIGDAFHPLAGVKAQDSVDGNITPKIKVTGEVNNIKPGTYVLVYSITNSQGTETKAQRTITVRAAEAKPPQLTVHRPNSYLQEGDSYDLMYGAKAYDEVDGDITSKIKVTPSTFDTSVAGDYTFTYTVTNSRGKTATEVVKITVLPAPVPRLEVPGDITITVGDAFDPMAGVDAGDQNDGNITAYVVVSPAKIDTSKPGTFTLTYSVKNSKGKTATAQRVVTVIAKEEPAKPLTPLSPADFGVGKGVEWPKQVFAPFVDMTAWTTDAAFANSGAVNLKKISEDTGTKYFHLGFIQSLGKVKDGKLAWGWGQFELNEANKDNPAYKEQYNGIKKSIRELREAGGDVSVSFGGANGTPFWRTTQDVTVLADTYRELIKGYGLTRIDLDIEGGSNGDYASNVANAKALKIVQAETGVQISLTLPVMDFGLTANDNKLLRAYLEQGVDIEMVNIMAMCYGASVGDYATASIKAIDNTQKQVKAAYATYAKTNLTNEQAYAKIGVTTSIGFESGAHPVFTTTQQKQVFDAAVAKKIGMVSFWSVNRDALLQKNSGVKARYEFTDICKLFGTEQPVAPKPDPKPDPKPEPKPDPKPEPKPDPKPEPKPEPKPDPQPSADTWSAAKTYVAGDMVVYKGKTFKAKWWVKGDNPEKGSAWEQVVAPNSDGSVDYISGKAYTGGAIVKYDGKNYKAKWWTNKVPGSDDSWQALQ